MPLKPGRPRRRRRALTAAERCAARAAAAMRPIGARITCCSGVVAFDTIAAGRSYPSTAARRSAIASRLGGHEHDQGVDARWPGLPARPSSPPARCPVTNATDAATPRWVTGIPAAAGAASAALTPGITRTGTPARCSASTSSPPRPKRKGSPPFRRTTRSPSRAAAIIASLMSACDAERRPRTLADVDEARSWIAQSAAPRHRRARRGTRRRHRRGRSARRG